MKKQPRKRKAPFSVRIKPELLDKARRAAKAKKITVGSLIVEGLEAVVSQ